VELLVPQEHLELLVLQVLQVSQIDMQLLLQLNLL
jgi:hypothetical protein